jgi:chemotaxis protein histidine kinase CheA
MNQLVSFFGEFREETSHISSVTNELQEGITNVRMVPIERLFKRYQRPVRDLAKAHEKKVEMEIQGGDTVLDKRLVEELADPLLHIVRNAVYHGIEPADIRERLGKPPTGKILLEAYHEGDSITITIQDDGRGIDGNRIKQSALQKGLITRAEYDSMTEEEAVNLVYLPGMSTLDVADGVSGRGVGMDVVLNNISELNGTIEIETAKSEGTKFIISLPLTLAISKALLLNVQDETFAVPLNSVLEILFIRKDEIKVVSGDEIIILREDVIPLKRLSNILNLEPRANGSLKYPVVIVGTAERRTALLVDKLLGREDIVVKSIGEFLSDVELFSGATISGEGKVRLILDVQKIVGYTIKSAGRVKVKAGMAPAKPEIVEGKGEAMVTPKILLVDDSISIRKFVGKLLERSGFQVTVAVDGLDALNKVEQETYDFFIVDLEMPRMHGYELIERLRQRSDFAQTPIMVMTSRSGEKHRQKAISLGADDYIVKPFTEETLIGTINRLLSV